MRQSKPQIACEMKVRKVHEYSETPSYEVLLYTKGARGWHRLTMTDGSRALFTQAPANEQEARAAIERYEEQFHAQEAA